jgi:hypothetical protein
LEDPEARGYFGRRPDESAVDHARRLETLRRINSPWYTAEAAKGAGAVAAVPLKLAKDAYDAADRLMTRGYQPGQQDEQAVWDALTASSVAGVNSFPFARPTGSLGTFIGRVGAKNLAEAGRPTAMRAIAEAERLDALGMLPEDVIRLEVNNLIRAEDPRLGGVHKGEDGTWRVEISDKDARVRQVGPSISKLGREYTHPELYQAYPDMPAVDYLRIPDRQSSYHKPGDPSEIGIGERSSSKRRSGRRRGWPRD